MKAIWQSALKIGLSIVLVSWLLYTTYWFFKSLNWWPLTSAVDFILGAFGTIGLALRIGAVLLVITTYMLLWRGKGWIKVTWALRYALPLEAVYFMCFFPSAVFGFLEGFNIVSGFHTLNQGGLWFLFETAIPTLVQATLVPFALLKLWSKLTANPSRQEVAKWACITGIAYLVYWWITYFGQWIASILQPASYAATYPGYGLGYVFNYPVNTFTFLLSAIGLPLLIGFFYWTSKPVISGVEKEFSLRNVGVMLTLLGFFFIVNIAFFHLYGYSGGASIWIIFFMFNNPDLWCITLPLIGILLILAKSKVKLE
jgi:hypothetical protein